MSDQPVNVSRQTLMAKLSNTNESRTIVQLSAIDSTGDSYHRMRWPARHLSEQAPNWRVINLDARARERFEWGEQADLLVIFQSNDLDLFPLIERRRRLGRKTLVELNDNYYDAPASAPIAEQWSSPVLWQTYERFLTESDGVIVTGPGLRDLFQQHTRLPIHILENHFPERLPEFDAVWTPPGETTNLGWAGSIGHLADLLAFEPVIRNVLEQSPRAVLHLMGNTAIPDWLTVPRERLKFTPWGGMSEYLRFWGPVQLGFVPLLDTACNRCRSDVKAVEMAACGVVPILPRALPYLGFLKATGLPAYDSFDTLRELLLEYLHDRSKLADAARTAFDYVKAERLGPERRERLQLYASLMPDKVSDYAWPLPHGCHETGGTPQGSMSWVPLLDELRNALRAGEPAQTVLTRLRNARFEHPFNPDVALAELNLLRRTGDLSLRERTRHYQHVFPRDVRFRLAEAEFASTHEDCTAVWQTLLEHLAAQPQPTRRFFESAVVSRLVRELESKPWLMQIGERCLEMYPASAVLRLAVARCDLRGAGHRAAAHFRCLLDQREAVLRQHEFFRTTDVAELATWQSALEARTRGVSWNDSTTARSETSQTVPGSSDHDHQAASRQLGSVPFDSPALRKIVPRRDPPAEIVRPILTERDFQLASEPMQLGRAHHTAGDSDIARRYFNVALTADPQNAVALLLRGLATWTAGDIAAGTADISRAKDVAPNSAVFHDQLACVLREIGEIDNAIAAARTAVALNPSRAEFRLNLADNLSLAGRHSEAEQACTAALQADSTSAISRHKLALSLLNQGRTAEALPILGEALRTRDVQRWQVAQAVIAELNAQTYLEIGVEQGVNLELIRAPRMLGVDPVAPMPRVRTLLRYGVATYFAQTSDEFFSRNAAMLREHPIDVAFVDGKHTFEQSLRDVENCLRFLSARGVVLMHDCNPTSQAMATPANSMEDVVRMAREGRLPGWTGQWEGWTGDVWKTIAYLRATREDLVANVLGCDFGIGVIRRGTASRLIDAPAAAIRTMTYRDLSVGRSTLLGLRPPGDLLDLLVNAETGRE